MERSCMCCQESGEREASVSLFCPKAKPGERKFIKVGHLFLMKITGSKQRLPQIFLNFWLIPRHLPFNKLILLIGKFPYWALKRLIILFLYTNVHNFYDFNWILTKPQHTPP